MLQSVAERRGWWTGSAVSMCEDIGSVNVRRFFFFFQAEDGIRDYKVTGVQTCALPIYGLFETAGSFTGLHFAIDGENNSPLSNFGGVVQTALGPFGNAFSDFRLYVDGQIGRASCRERV